MCIRDRTDPDSVLDRAERDALISTTGYFPHGLPDLRIAIASQLTERAGLPADPSQVLVTTGGQQAVDLLIRSEVLPGQPVAVEDPTFPGALDALHRAGARVIGIPAGEGVDPERLEHVVRTHRPAMVYLIPTHHNPTGLVMATQVRRRVATIACWKAVLPWSAAALVAASRAIRPLLPLIQPVRSPPQ